MSLKENILENKQLTHIVVETVVLLGLTYYVTSKNKELMHHIEALSERLEEHTDQIQEMQKVIREIKSSGDIEQYIQTPRKNEVPPVHIPSDQRLFELVERPVQRPHQEQPAQRPQEQPAQRPQEQPAQRPHQEQPAQRPHQEQPAQRPHQEQPAQRPQEQPAQRPRQEQPVQRPHQEQPAQRPEQRQRQPQRQLVQDKSLSQGHTAPQQYRDKQPQIPEEDLDAVLADDLRQLNEDED